MKLLPFFAAFALSTAMLAGCTKTEPDNKPDNPETKTPEIIIDELNPEIGAEGGEISISYTIENPAETGTISAETDENASWIEVSSISATDIVLTVEANDITETRQTDVTVIYTYGENSDTVSCTVTVMQAELVPDPEIKTDGQSVRIPVEGGQASAEFSVMYAVDGGKISATTEADWLTIDEVGGNEIKMTATENIFAKEKTAIINLVYSYGDGESVTAELKVIQDAVEVSVDYYMPVAYISGEYYDYGAIFRYFRIKLSDMEITEGEIAEGASSYDLTLYVSDVDDPANPWPQAGTYKYGTMTAGTFSGWFYPVKGAIGAEIKEGTAEVSVDGENLLIELDLKDADGKTHYARYSGKPVFEIAVQM